MGSGFCGGNDKVSELEAPELKYPLVPAEPTLPVELPAAAADEDGAAAGRVEDLAEVGGSVFEDPSEGRVLDLTLDFEAELFPLVLSNFLSV